MDQLQYQKEILEAIEAAQTTLNYLNNAQQHLNSAGNWGLMDMFGGGLFTTLVKHNKMDDTERELSYARNAMNNLSKELEDIGQIETLHIDTDDFLTFADYFCDGLVADWLVQSKIDEAKNRVSQAQMKVNHIIRSLQDKLK